VCGHFGISNLFRAVKTVGKAVLGKKGTDFIHSEVKHPNGDRMISGLREVWTFYIWI